MQYPGTIDNWFDQSGISAEPAVEVTPRPLMLTAAAFDRGPEGITRVCRLFFCQTWLQVGG